MQLNIKLIQNQLFAFPKRSKILNDFGVTSDPGDATAFANEILQQLDQKPDRAPYTLALTNRCVFKAAVRAIGSNSRDWSTFLRNEQGMRKLLHNYDPQQTKQDISRGLLDPAALEGLLPGITKGKDARAILSWAKLLAEPVAYYASLCALAEAFERVAQKQGLLPPLAPEETFLCVAGYLGDPPRKWDEDTSSFPGKAVGMGYALASEFLRNLRWSGFKPDRHVIRLFNHWKLDKTASSPRAAQLANLIGRQSKGLNEYLTYSLLGIGISPDGMPLSHADNLIWLLGKYVEPKRHQSQTSYIC